MSSAPNAAAPSAGGVSPAAPSSNTNNARRPYYRRTNNANTSNNNDNANRILKNDIFDIGATANADQFRRTLEAIENHVQTTYKDAGDIVIAIRTLAPPSTIVAPTAPARDLANPDAYDILKIHYETDYRAYAAADRIYKSHLVNAWGLIYGQCTTALKSQLEGMTEYSTARSTNDIIELLKLIRGICCKFDVKSQKYVALAATFRQAFVYFQDNNTSNDDFFHHYKSILGTIQSFGGDDAIGVIPNFVDEDLPSPPPPPPNRRQPRQNVKSASWPPPCSDAPTLPSSNHYAAIWRISSLWATTTIPKRWKECWTS